MPNRIVREGINSNPRVNSLSLGAEVFFRRLMSVADDYGRYHGSVVTIRGACWPTCPEKVTDLQVKKWLAECTTTTPPLIHLYESDGSQYLRIDGFGQQIRTKSKFPAPPDGTDISLRKSHVQPADSLIPDCLQNDLASRSRNAKSDAKAQAQALAPTTPVAYAPQCPRAADLSGMTSSRFEEWWKSYPRQQRMDLAARQWNSVVTVEVEAAVFACTTRYLASDEVARGVITNPDRWLYEQHRNDWKGNWPKVRDTSRGSPTTAELARSIEAFGRTR